MGTRKGWTHAICGKCWNERRPDRPYDFARGLGTSDEPCCFCGGAKTEGIYLRHDGEKLPLCRGHGDPP